MYLSTKPVHDCMVNGQYDVMYRRWTGFAWQCY